jgi:hypothetical protein
MKKRMLILSKETVQVLTSSEARPDQTREHGTKGGMAPEGLTTKNCGPTVSCPSCSN